MYEQKSRNPFLAALATFGTPGLGQLYNGQLRKAVSTYSLVLLNFVILGFTSLPYGFYGLFFLLCADLIALIEIIADAALSAKKRNEYSLKKFNRWYVYVGVIIIHSFVVSPVFMNFLVSPRIKAYRIPSGGMLPNIQTGDCLIVDKMAYKANPPARGDIVAFDYPLNPSLKFIKRIMGLPGETFAVKEGRIFINGDAINDPWGKHLDRFGKDTKPVSPGRNFGPVQIPENKFIVLGDNRNNSQDSRYWGYVKHSAIIGKVLYVYWADDKSRIGHEFNEK